MKNDSILDGEQMTKLLLKFSKTELERCFRIFDADGSGELDNQEMYQMAKLLNIPRDAMKTMIKEINTCSEGTIKKDEWLSYIDNLARIKKFSVASNL